MRLFVDIGEESAIVGCFCVKSQNLVSFVDFTIDFERWGAELFRWSFVQGYRFAMVLLLKSFI